LVLLSLLSSKRVFTLKERTVFLFLLHKYLQRSVENQKLLEGFTLLDVNSEISDKAHMTNYLIALSYCSYGRYLEAEHY